MLLDDRKSGDYLTIARRAKNRNDWFLGSITDENNRELNLTLTFLEPAKKYEATIYRDAADADWQSNPEAYTIEKKLVTNKAKLKVPLAKSGGCAISIMEIKK